MQDNDQSRRAGRPSLLSEQSPEGDSHSILSKLDGGPGAVKSGGAGRAGARVAGIAAAVALTGGALGWVLSSPEVSADAPGSLAAVATKPQIKPPAPVPSVPAAAPAVPVAVASTPSGATSTDSNLGVAAILDETPAKAEPSDKSLAAALAAPSPKTANAAGGKDELMALLDKPTPDKADKADMTDKKAPAHADEPKAKSKTKNERKAEPVRLAQADKSPRKDKAAKEKLAARDKAKDKDKTRTVAAAARAKPTAKPKAKAPVDSDVALLAALLAHSKKSPARSKTSMEYQKCSTLDTVAAADKCREQLCVGKAKNTAECKPPRVAKASS